jgi:tripartite-type tricarboxylate transporter receptor subunit TctC
MLNRRQFVTSLAFTPLARPALAAAWPQRPVRIIFPYAAGGAADAAARLLAQRLGKVFSQSFIVEARPGANGALAAETVARAPADGYTLFWATTPQIAIAPAMSKVPYDPVKDFTPISAAITNTFVLVVNPRFPTASVAEFVDYVRARPGQLSYADGSTGSVGHLAMELFLKRANLEMTHVSYRGNPPALSDVVAGHLPAMFSLLGDALPFAASGNIRLLAVSSERRSPLAPDVPTVAESGYPGYRATSWNGLLAPAGTPQPVIDRLSLEVARAVSDVDFARRLTGLGVEPLGNSPAEFAAMISSDIGFWREAVQIARIARE